MKLFAFYLLDAISRSNIFCRQLYDFGTLSCLDRSMDGNVRVLSSMPFHDIDRFLHRWNCSLSIFSMPFHEVTDPAIGTVLSRDRNTLGPVIETLLFGKVGIFTIFKQFWKKDYTKMYPSKFIYTFLHMIFTSMGPCKIRTCFKFHAHKIAPIIAKMPIHMTSLLRCTKSGPIIIIDLQKISGPYGPDIRRPRHNFWSRNRSRGWSRCQFAQFTKVNCIYRVTLQWQK